jgi:hypothetical protein
LCAWCGTRFNDPDADHPVRGGVTDDATRVDLGEPYSEPQPTIWDYGVPRTPQSGPWAASPTIQDYEAPLLPGFGYGEQAAPSGGYYPEPQQVPDDPWATPPRQYPADAGQPPPDGPRPGGHRRPSQGRPRGTLVAAGVLIMLALGGGAYALTSALTGHPGRPSAQGPVTAPTTPAARTSPLPATAPVATAARTPRPASPTTVPDATAPATTVPPATTAPATTAPAQVTPATEPPDTEPPTSPAPSASPRSPGTTTVATTAAARASAAEPGVAQFLADYFTAINNHDYQAYLALLDPAQAARESPARFAAGYGTTTDSDATLTAIADRGNGREAASVTFTSHQAPSASPDHSSCDVWQITLYLGPGDGGYLLRRPPSGYGAHVQSCS